MNLSSSLNNRVLWTVSAIILIFGLIGFAKPSNAQFASLPPGGSLFADAVDLPLGTFTATIGANEQYYKINLLPGQQLVIDGQVEGPVEGSGYGDPLEVEVDNSQYKSVLLYAKQPSLKADISLTLTTSSTDDDGMYYVTLKSPSADTLVSPLIISVNDVYDAESGTDLPEGKEGSLEIGNGEYMGYLHLYHHPSHAGNDSADWYLLRPSAGDEFKATLDALGNNTNLAIEITNPDGQLVSSDRLDRSGGVAISQGTIDELAGEMYLAVVCKYAVCEPGDYKLTIEGLTSGGGENTMPPAEEDTSREAEQKAVTDYERGLVTVIDQNLVTNLEGYILLQVDEKGQAWYLDPSSRMKYFLRDGDIAYIALRNFGLGITNADLAKIPVGLIAEFQGTDTDGDGIGDKTEEGLGTDMNNPDTDGDGYSDYTEVMNNFNPLGPGSMPIDQSMVERLKGRILLQVDELGQAWYVNPVDGLRYYMADGYMAYQIMRRLSLGITNADIRKIGVGDIY